MKKIKLLSMLVAMATAIGLFSACTTGKASDYVVKQNLSNFINVIVDDSEPTYTTGIGYQMEINYTQNTVTIILENLKLPDGSTYGQLTFKNVPYIFTTQGWMEIRLSGYTPVADAGLNVPVFNTFVMRILDRYAANGALYYPLFDIRYTTQNYSIVSMPSALICEGTTVVTSEGKPAYSPSESDITVYGINLDVTNRKASILIQGAKFAEAMPAMNMQFNDIPLTLTSYGQADLSIDYLEPVLVTGTNTTTPAPNFPISNLHCVADAQNNMNLTFTCTIKGQLENGEEISTPYHVTVVCNTPSYNLGSN